MAKKIMNNGYDLVSSPMHRVFRHYLCSRFIPMGFYHGGAGLKCLVVLSVTHCLGRPIFCFLTRFEPQMARLYRVRARIFS